MFVAYEDPIDSEAEKRRAKFIKRERERAPNKLSPLERSFQLLYKSLVRQLRNVSNDIIPRGFYFTN